MACASANGSEGCMGHFCWLKFVFCCRSGAASQAAPADAAIAWRRNIYADGMYAVTAGMMLAYLPRTSLATPVTQTLVCRRLAVLHQ